MNALAQRIAFPPNWWARACWLLLAAYIVYACSLLDFTWARFMIGLDNGARFYFLHSFYFSPANAGDVIARADYNGPFACAVRSGNVFGVQFHPEKSHQWGIQLLRNFAGLS